MGTTFSWADEGGKLQVVKFDIINSEELEDVVTVTSHPVERGANVADHARDEPERITVEGFVTNVPHHGNLTDDDDYEETSVPVSVPVVGNRGTQTIELDLPEPPLSITPSGLIQAAVGAVVDLFTGGTQYKAEFFGEIEKTQQRLSVKLLTTSSPKDRPRFVYEKLLTAKEGHYLITVQSRMREYFDMLIERVSVPRAAEDGTGARISVDLRRIRVADSETVQSPEPAEARGQTTKSRGSQHAAQDPNAEKKDEEYASSAWKGKQAAKKRLGIGQ